MTNRLKTSTAIVLIFIVLLLLARTFGVDTRLSTFVDDQRTVLVVFGLLMAAFQVYFAICVLGRRTVDLVHRKIQLRELEGRLKRLSAMEKYVLSLFVSENKMERALDPEEGAIAWLEAIKIITAVGRTTDGKKEKYRITPFAMKVLAENPNLLH